MGLLTKLIAATCIGAAGSYQVATHVYTELAKENKQLLRASRRGSNFLITGGRLIALYTLSSVPEQEKHKEGAKMVSAMIRENGGIYIKLGQSMANMETVVPDEYIEEMKQFFQNCPESSFENISLVFHESTGQKLEEVFSEFDQRAMNSGSIAQVHKATLRSNGQKVAVKVQHRFLKEQCAGDIWLAGNFFRTVSKLFPDFKYSWIAAAVESNIPKELDFDLEAANAALMSSIFKENPYIKVPHIYKEYSSDKVLVMEFAEGVSIDKVEEIKKMGLDLRQVSKILSDNYCQQIFKFGVIHADPHPGNIFVAVQKDKNGRKKPLIIFLDHGIYKILPENVRIQYSYLWKGIFTQDEEMVKEACTHFGVLEYYPMIVSMMMSKDYNAVMKDQKKGLSAEGEYSKAEAKDFAQMKLKEILAVLERLNSDISALFKTNDFLKTIDRRLIGSKEKRDLSLWVKYCFEAVEEDVKKKKKTTLTGSIMLTLQRLHYYLGLKLWNFLSFFMPNVFQTPSLLDF